MDPQSTVDVLTEVGQTGVFAEIAGVGTIHRQRHFHLGWTVAENDQAVSHDQGFIDVVGDEDDRLLDKHVHVDDFFPQVHSGEKVQPSKGFIHEEDIGVDHQGSGQLGPALHASGELVRIEVLGARQSNDVNTLLN